MTLVSVLMTLIAGLVFLSFAYIMNVAQVKRSLYECGLVVEEETLNTDRKSKFDQIKILRDGYSSVEAYDDK